MSAQPRRRCDERADVAQRAATEGRKADDGKYADDIELLVRRFEQAGEAKPESRLLRSVSGRSIATVEEASRWRAWRGNLQ